MKNGKVIFCLAMIWCFVAQGQPILHVKYDPNTLGDISDIAWISTSEYWLSSTSGIAHYTNYGNNENFHLIDTAGWTINASCITFHNGEIWTGDSDSGVYKYDGSTWSYFLFQHGMVKSPVIDIQFLSNNEIIVLTESAILKYDSAISKFQSFGAGGSSLFIYNDFVYVGDDVSTQKPGVYYNGSIWIDLPVIPGVPSMKNRSKSIVVTNDSVIYSLSSFRLSYLKNSIWTDVNGTPNSDSKLIVLDTSVAVILQDRLSLVHESQVDTINDPTYNLSSSGLKSLIGLQGQNTLSCVGGTSQRQYLFEFSPFWDFNNSVYQELNNGKIRAGFSPTGDLFRDFRNNSPNDGYIGFNADGKMSIFASNLWMLGMDNDTLSCIQQYRQWGSDQFSGPISQVYDSAYLSRFNNVWRVTLNEINNHKQNYSNAGYKMPYGIAQWPGNGDDTKGESKFLAPFADNNYNGIYEPMQGEYPAIRGDQAVYFIFNDERGVKSESPSKFLNIEVHGMAYIYDTLQFPALHNTLFLSYKLVNKSVNDYNNFIVGLWNDIDLGNAQDDVIGSDSVYQIAYAYNGDNNDEGPLGYGSFPPAVGHIVLSDTLEGVMYYNNSANSYSGNPLTVGDFSNYLSSHWKNGFPLIVENPSGPGSTLNGDGFVPTGMGQSTKWAYNDSLNWYESPANQADKRLLSYFNLGQFNSGTKKCVDMAILYARDSSSTDLLGSVVKLKGYASDIRQFYQNQNFECLGAVMEVSELLDKKKLSIYPNPVGKSCFLTIESKQILDKIELISMTGQVVRLEIIEGLLGYQTQIPSSCSSGIYVIKAYTTKHEFIINKISIF